MRRKAHALQPWLWLAVGAHGYRAAITPAEGLWHHRWWHALPELGIPRALAVGESNEDIERQQRRDDEVGHIDDLADAQVHCHAAQGVGLLPVVPARTQVLDHV